MSVQRPRSWVGPKFGVDKPSNWVGEDDTLSNFAWLSIQLQDSHSWSHRLFIQLRFLPLHESSWLF